MTGFTASARGILIGSVLFTACTESLIPVPTQRPASPDAECLLARHSGRLVADARWGIALDDPAGFVRELLWPYGFVAARRDGRVVLLNGAGQVVAGEGDTVAMTGGEVGSNGPWLVCAIPGSLEVISRGLNQ